MTQKGRENEPVIHHIYCHHIISPPNRMPVKGQNVGGQYVAHSLDHNSNSKIHALCDEKTLRSTAGVLESQQQSLRRFGGHSRTKVS